MSIYDVPREISAENRARPAAAVLETSLVLCDICQRSFLDRQTMLDHRAGCRLKDRQERYLDKNRRGRPQAQARDYEAFWRHREGGVCVRLSCMCLRGGNGPGKEPCTRDECIEFRGEYMLKYFVAAGVKI